MCRNHSEKQLRNKKTSDLCEPGKCGESELHQNKCCYINLVCPKNVILQFWIVASYTKDHLNTQLSRSVDVHLHGKSVFLGQYVILGMSYKYGQEPYCITITGFCLGHNKLHHKEQYHASYSQLSDYQKHRSSKWLGMSIPCSCITEKCHIGKYSTNALLFKVAQ